MIGESRSSNWSSSQYDGDLAELEFGKLLFMRDPLFTRPARTSEQFAHIDWVSRLGKYDVKARKRIRRGDSSTQDTYVWLEIHNVRGGLGWLRGHSDYIAFEREHDFVVVGREDLLNMASELCNYNVVTSPDEELYALYSRDKRKDLLTMVKFSDILRLEHECWEKSG